MRLPTSLRQEYERLGSDHSPYLERAREAAKLTLPALLPPEGKQGASRLRRGFSNFGARLVNSLASKLVLSMLPARQSFFRLIGDERVIQAAGGEEAQSDIDIAFSKMEAKVQEDIETTPTRTPVAEAIKHLIVAGNVLVYLMPKGGVKVYPLHSYRCLRDGEGNVLRILAEDRVSPLTLPESVRGAVVAKMVQKGDASPDKLVSIFTGVFRLPEKWVIWQEVEGIELPGSRGSYPVDACPWLALRWTPVDGESYGRGMVEDYLGYLTALEGLTGAIVKGSAVAAKLVYLRNPNGKTKASALSRANTGDVIDGSVEDVKALTADKFADFRTARETMADLKEELSYAFAMNQAIQRNAERVTAEEIRYMAQELDSLLGGIFSALSLEFQLPFLRVTLARLERQRKLPTLPKGSVRPMIVTGLDALGRGAELDNLRAMVKDIVDLGGPEALATYVYFDDLLKRLAVARGVKAKGLIKPQDVVKAEQQQKQLASMVEQLGPNVINALGKAAQAQPQAPQ